MKHDKQEMLAKIKESSQQKTKFTTGTNKILQKNGISRSKV